MAKKPVLTPRKIAALGKRLAELAAEAYTLVDGIHVPKRFVDTPRAWKAAQDILATEVKLDDGEFIKVLDTYIPALDLRRFLADGKITHIEPLHGSYGGSVLALALTFESAAPELLRISCRAIPRAPFALTVQAYASNQIGDYLFERLPLIEMVDDAGDLQTGYKTERTLKNDILQEILAQLTREAEMDPNAHPFDIKDIGILPNGQPVVVDPDVHTLNEEWSAFAMRRAARLDPQKLIDATAGMPPAFHYIQPDGTWTQFQFFRHPSIGSMRYMRENIRRLRIGPPTPTP